MAGTLAAIIAAAATAPPPLAGQSSDVGQLRREVFEIEASNNRTYEVHVLLPADHGDADKPIEALYYLDAWWWREIVEGTYRLLYKSTPSRVKPIALIGVSIRGDAEEWNRQRNKDYTPTSYRPSVPGVTFKTGGVVVDSAGTGGAPAFLAFLEEELIPRVEKRFNLDARRGLIGHSFGGLFVTWVSRVRPGLFNKLVAISPATYWNSYEVMSTGGDAAAGQAEPVTALVVVGGAELGGMRRSADSTAAALRQSMSSQIETQTVEGADHTTVIPAAILIGLVRLYGRGN